MKPYYQDDWVELYHGNCRELLYQVRAFPAMSALVTDPPYPNNAGHFVADIPDAEAVLSLPWQDAIVFWSELSVPPVPQPLVAVHIWHRSNVNGRPYEPAYHFAIDGRKRRSEVLRYPAIFDGAGPGCNEYLGHPTQKPSVVMRTLIEKTTGTVIDPFCGVGSTLHAAKYAGRRAIGIERNEAYCEIAARRLSQDVLDFGEAS